MLEEIIKTLEKNSDTKKAKDLQRFFKTGKGDYGEGDIFAGITVPIIRGIAKKFVNISFDDIQKLLRNKIHEYRLTALIILVYKFERKDTSDEEKKQIVGIYLANTKYINNWDLVDLSCYKILGKYLLDKDKDILYKLANSKSLWEQRIAIISTMTFIRINEFDDVLEISKRLLTHKHDLIHKAIGWMLREVGKRDMQVEEGFLRQHYKEMPRTMLRYAIEKFPEERRKGYLEGRV